MAERPICNWIGKSGKTYKFYIYALPVTFKPGQTGNYIYAKKNVKGQWSPVYVGEGELCDRCGDAHHQAKCIASKGATHFHCHINEDERARLAEERDLLEKYTQALAPRGCNETRYG